MEQSMMNTFSNALTNVTTLEFYKNLFPAYTILVVYFLVMMVTSTIGHALDQENGFTNGLFFGMLLSLFLWFSVGKKMSYLK